MELLINLLLSRAPARQGAHTGAALVLFRSCVGFQLHHSAACSCLVDLEDLQAACEAVLPAFGARPD